MAEQRVYSSNPGDDVLLGSGPIINVVETVNQTVKSANGRGVLGLVGAVVDDGGQPNVATILDNKLADIYAKHGGFKPWLGDGLASGQAGATSGYEGNLAAHCENLDAPVVVLTIPDLAIKDATYASGTNLLVRFTRSDASYGEVTIPAGTRVSDGSTYILATLQDVYYSAAETGDKSVRARQVSDTGVTPVALNTVTTVVDTLSDSNITINTADTTVPDLIDAAELVLRYTAAFNAVLDTAAGKQIQVMACDRQEPGVCDALSSHCATATASGYHRICTVSPPLATTATNARGSGTDGVGRAGLTTARAAYAHPGWRRPFLADSANLTAPTYLATVPSAISLACRIAVEIPEQNPANPHQILRDHGVSGVESLAAGAVSKSAHWAANITQPDFDKSETGALSATFHAGLMANGTEIADRRMNDYIQLGCISRAKPHHKKLATPSRRTAVTDAVIGFLQQLKDSERIGNFSVSSTWDAATNHLTVTVAVALLGNLNVITFNVEASTSTVIVTEAA